MPEALLNQYEVDAASRELRGQGVFQDVRVALMWRQARGFSVSVEDGDELRAMQAAALLRSEQGIEAIRLAGLRRFA